MPPARPGTTLNTHPPEPLSAGRPPLFAPGSEIASAHAASGPPLVVWTVAGYDPSSGAGITADLQTFAAHGLFGCSAITALTAQSTLGVAETAQISPTFFRRTLDHLAADLPPRGLKIGMLGSPEITEELADFLACNLDRSAAECRDPRISEAQPTAPPANAPTRSAPTVLDPVLRSSSGRELYPAAALETLHTRLFPHITWLTPNWPELSALTDHPVTTQETALAALEALAAGHPHLHIVATGGGHAHPTDILSLPTARGREYHAFEGHHIETRSTHGTGCAFSSALLSALVLGLSPIAAVAHAKRFVTEALRTATPIGHGRGPLNLLWPLRRDSE